MLLALQLNNLLMDEGSESDLTPDAFTFSDVSGATPSTVYTSNEITITGLGEEDTATVTITVGTYSKNGGAYTASAGTAVNGDTFVVRATSSGSYSTGVSAVLTVGTVSDTYTVTTYANQAPVFAGPAISDFSLVIDRLMIPRSYGSLYTDIESLTYTIQGTLPTGLSLSSAGVLSGTPTVLGLASSLEIRASDGSLTVDSNSFAINIVAAATGGARRHRSRLGLGMGLG